MSAYALPGLFPPLPCQTACPVSRFDASVAQRMEQPPRVRCRVQNTRIDALQLVQVLTNKRSRRRPPPNPETAMKFDLEITDMQQETHHVTCSLDAIRKLRTDLSNENGCVGLPLPDVIRGGNCFSDLTKCLETLRPHLERWLQYTFENNPHSYSLKSFVLPQTPLFKKSSSLESIQESDDEE